MNAYATLDYLPDLTFSQMAAARNLTFRPHLVPAVGWDRTAGTFGDNAFALQHSVYRFTASEGATYDLFSTSYFDPYLLRVYDRNGNTIVANNENDDGASINLPLPGGSFMQDVIYNWVAPYSGTFYVEASWNQSNVFRYYSLDIYEDIDTVANKPVNTVTGLNLGKPTPSSYGLTGDNIIDAMTTGSKWALDGTRVIDVSISYGFRGEAWVDPVEVSTSLRAALGSFSQLANVKFNYLGHFSDPAQAALAGSEINLSIDSEWVFFSSKSQWARAFFPSPLHSQTPYAGAAGDVYLNINSAANTLPSYTPGSAGWFLLLHELGHSMGLKHPHDDGGTSRPTLAEVGFDVLDIDLATIMSYNDDAFANLVQWDPATPMVLDALALQYLYGPNNSSFVGDTAHKLRADSFYTTLWDASGLDTLDVQTETEGWTIYLPDVALSTAVGTKVGVAMPTSDMERMVPKTITWLLGDYENVRGSRFDDTVFTNTLNNQIDTGLGRDSVVWAESHDHYRIERSATGWVVQPVLGEGGIDRLENVERLVFGDRAIALDLNSSAGTVAKTLGAVFGAAAVKNLGFVGIGLHFMDAYGYSSQSLMQLALEARLGALPSHDQVVRLLFSQVMGHQPSDEVRQSFVSLLDSGAHSIASLGVIAADTAANRTNIDLVGLVQTGLAYQPYES